MPNGALYLLIGTLGAYFILYKKKERERESSPLFTQNYRFIACMVFRTHLKRTSVVVTDACYAVAAPGITITFVPRIS
jgi:hypothetical protein